MAENMIATGFCPSMGQMDKLLIIQQNKLAPHFALSERRQCFFLCR